MPGRLRRYRQTLAGLATAIALLAVVASPASAVTDGTLDGNQHPYVGLMTAHDATAITSGAAAAP
jgi:hypothetical protein